MPFPRPTLRDLVRRTSSDVESELSGSDALLRRSLLGALSRALAGALHALYGYLAWIARQLFSDTAEKEALLRRAAAYGISPNAAARARGNIAVAGVDGTPIDAGTAWQRGDRVVYVSTAAAMVAGGAATVAVEAREAGAGGNAESGVKVSLVSPIAGVVSEAAADGDIAGGHDRESVDSVRARYQQRLREPPQGGTVPDYDRWVREAHQSVTRRWVRPRARGLGTVDVYIMTDTATPNGIPAAPLTAAVQAYVDGRRPVTADVDVIAPTPVAFDVTIQSLVPDTAAVRAAVEAELADLILRDSEPGGTILLTHVREAISAAMDEDDHVLVAPAANVAHGTAEIAVLGAVTWQE